jgi:hypothetical protein
VPRFPRLVRLAAIAVLAAACNAAPPSGPSSSSAAGPSAAPPSAASSPSISASPAAASTAPDASAQICPSVKALATALAKLKALDPMTASTADLQAAAHDVGQTGATLIVLGAKAEHLRPLNIGAQLISSMFDQSSHATASERAQALQQFENTAQLVLNELGACS